MIPYSLHSIGDEEIQAVMEVMRSGWLTGGPKVAKFEVKFAEYVGARHAIAVNSGAAALYLAVKALFPVPRVRIAIPTLTYVATANAVVLAGHTPVFCDVDPETFCIDPSKIPGDVDGVIPVHYGGHPCDLHEIQDIGEIKSGGWIIIEDAAHACGAEYKGKKIGSLNTTCFSFHPCKNMTTAEGGLITTNDQELADKLRRMRLNGIQKDGLRQDMIDWGFKFNMNEISAAIGIEQLKKLDRMNERRVGIAAKYERAFMEMSKIRTQKTFSGTLTSRHLFPILVENRDELADHLLSQGIITAIHYKPVHLMTWYKDRFGGKEGDFPIAENIAKHVLSIPIYPDMTDEQVDYVIQMIKEGI